MKANQRLTSIICALALSMLLVTGCGGTNTVDTSSDGVSQDTANGTSTGTSEGDTSGQAPADFSLPVYSNWTMVGDQMEAKSRIVIFRYEGERSGVQEQYARDLEALGLDVAVDGFRLIAEGELQGKPLKAQIVFQQGSGLTQVTFSLQESTN